MNIRYRIELSPSERYELTALLSGGRHAARPLKRVHILLAADAGTSDEVMAANLAVSGSTIYRTKRGFVEANLEGALKEEPRRAAARKEETLLMATACSKLPVGGGLWTLELLAGESASSADNASTAARRQRSSRRRNRRVGNSAKCER